MRTFRWGLGTFLLGLLGAILTVAYVLIDPTAPASPERMCDVTDIIAAIIAVVGLLFVHWLWKLRVFQGWLVLVPYVSGPWTVDATGDEGPNQGTATFHQSLSKLRVTLESAKGVAKSVTAEIGRDETTKRTFVVYTYEAPRETAFLEVVANGEMTGTYYTDRGTLGSLRLTR